MHNSSFCVLYVAVLDTKVRIDDLKDENSFRPCRLIWLCVQVVSESANMQYVLGKRGISLIQR